MVESKEKHDKNKHKLYNCPFYTANNHGELVTALVLHSPLQWLRPWPQPGGSSQFVSG